MAFEWDPAKARLNLEKHGIAFEAAVRFEFDTAVTFDDMRADYGERRQIAIGFIGDRLCVMAFTSRGEKTRIISLRKPMPGRNGAMSTISRQADVRALALAKANRQLEEMSWAEDLGITVVALTDPDNPPMEFDESRDVRLARPKRKVELTLDIDLLEHLAESPDWEERVNEILRLAARMDALTASD